jgi:phosphoribosylformylglycinamidine synthase
VLPGLDLDTHERVARATRQLVAGGIVTGAHDVSEGGLGLALAEMAVRSGVGVSVARVSDHAELFSEAPSRVVLCVPADQLTMVERVAEAAGVLATRIGAALGDRITVKGLLDVSLDRATAAWRDRLPTALGGGTTQG